MKTYQTVRYQCHTNVHPQIGQMSFKSVEVAGRRGNKSLDLLRLLLVVVFKQLSIFPQHV